MDKILHITFLITLQSQNLCKPLHEHLIYMIANNMFSYL